MIELSKCSQIQKIKHAIKLFMKYGHTGSSYQIWFGIKVSIHTVSKILPNTKMYKQKYLPFLLLYYLLFYKVYYIMSVM